MLRCGGVRLAYPFREAPQSFSLPRFPLHRFAGTFSPLPLSSAFLPSYPPPLPLPLSSASLTFRPPPLPLVGVPSPTCPRFRCASTLSPLAFTKLCSPRPSAAATYRSLVFSSCRPVAPSTTSPQADSPEAMPPRWDHSSSGGFSGGSACVYTPNARPRRRCSYLRSVRPRGVRRTLRGGTTHSAQ